MPSKKKKYNARFPAGRIKKIMQSDEDVGKVAQAVPVIISRTLELFVESLLTKALRITNARNAKTLSPSHMKQCIMSESCFDFLRDLVQNVPDINAEEQLTMGAQNPTYNAGAEPDDEPTPHTPVLSYGPSPTSRDFPALSHPSTSNYGVYVPSDSPRNGVKRCISGVPIPSHTAHPQYYETAGRPATAMLMHKQQSLDLSLATGPKNNSTTPANYYTEIQSEATASPLNLDVRLPKITRINSVPVNISASSSRSAPTTPANPNLASAPPVINFDFSNGVATTFVQQYQTPIARLNLSLSTPLTTPGSPATFGGAIDVCNSPLVKIDYSQLDLSTPSSPTTVSRQTPLPAATVAAAAYTKVPATRGRPPKNRSATVTTPNPAMPPVMTFDLTQQPISCSSSSKSQPLTNSTVGSSSSCETHHGSVTSASSKSNGVARPETEPFVATSSCQDMDEDYDNI